MIKVDFEKVGDIMITIIMFILVTGVLFSTGFMYEKFFNHRGDRRNKCYPNNTCNKGYTCIYNKCRDEDQ